MPADRRQPLRHRRNRQAIPARYGPRREGAARRSSGRMPRTNAPAAPISLVAMTWPSINGVTPVTPGTSLHLCRLGVEIGKRAGLSINSEMAVETKDAAEEVGAKTVHHRHDDDQGGNPEGDPEQRKDRDDRDETFLPPRPQIAKRDHALECAEDHAGGTLSPGCRSGAARRAEPGTHMPSSSGSWISGRGRAASRDDDGGSATVPRRYEQHRSSAVSTEMSCRSPERRCFISTVPAAIPRGPMTS